MALVDWEYYSSKFPKVNQDDFIRLIDIAEWEILKMIPPYVFDELTQEDTNYKFVRLKDTICKIINFISTNENIPVNSGVTSVSNDGYSESYAISKQSEMQDELTRNCIRWLSGTGLLGAL